MDIDLFPVMDAECASQLVRQVLSATNATMSVLQKLETLRDASSEVDPAGRYLDDVHKVRSALDELCVAVRSARNELSSTTEADLAHFSRGTHTFGGVTTASPHASIVEFGESVCILCLFRLKCALPEDTRVTDIRDILGDLMSADFNVQLAAVNLTALRVVKYGERCGYRFGDATPSWNDLSEKQQSILRAFSKPDHDPPFQQKTLVISKERGDGKPTPNERDMIAWLHEVGFLNRHEPRGGYCLIKLPNGTPSDSIESPVMCESCKKSQST